MGKALGFILQIAVAIFAPYAAAALGLTGFAATAFSFVAQGLVGKLVGGSGLFGGDKGGGTGAGGFSDSGLLVNKQGTLGPVRIIYGERRIGAQRIYIDTTNGNGQINSGADRDKFLHAYFAVAEGEIAGIRGVWFQDRLAWRDPAYADMYSDNTDSFDANGVNTHFGNLLRFAYWKGTNNQYMLGANATTAFNTAGTSGNNWTETPTWMSEHWTEAHRCRDVVVAAFRLEYDRKKFPGVPNIQFDVDGRKVVDLFDGVSDALIERKNPANCLYDYLTNTVYGKGLDPNDIDIESFRLLRAYNVCKGLEVNGAIDPGETIFNNTQHLLTAANAFLVFANGKYKVKPLGKLSHTFAYEFNEDNIIGEVSIALGSKKNRNNRLKVNYFDPEIGFQPNTLLIPDSDDPLFDQYLDADSGVINESSVDLRFSSEERQARVIGEYLLKQSRYQTTMSFKATYEALKLEVGDPCWVDYPTAGWTGVNRKKFRVVSVTLQQDATTDVTLLEYPDIDIYIPNHDYGPSVTFDLGEWTCEDL